MQSNLYRFRGVRALYGEEAFKNFQKSHVLIVGTGGVGSWAIECLVRTGIGEITIIDNDIIDEGNSNRQLHTLVSTYGQTKASVMKNRMLDINPDLKISIKEVFLTPENIGNLITSDVDYIIDAIDSLESKVNLIDYAKKNNIPIVVAGGAAGKTDPLMVKVADLADVKYDRLLSRTRNVLRKQLGYPKNGKKMKIKAVYCEQESILSREINPGDDLPKIGASMCVTSTCGLNLAAVVLKDLNS